MKKFKGILWGIVVIILGIIWGLNRSGVTNIDLLFDGWWTLFIIVPCAIELFTDKNKTGPIIGLLIGVLLLINANVDISFIKPFILPAIVIVVGIAIIINTITQKNNSANNQQNFNQESYNGYDSKNNEHFATFTNQRFVVDNEFYGGKFSATFGGITIDLTNAVLSDNTYVNLSSTFGGIDLIVPNDVTVIISSSSLFGGVNNKHINPTASDKTIHISANCLFGGVNIK